MEYYSEIYELIFAITIYFNCDIFSLEMCIY